LADLREAIRALTVIDWSELVEAVEKRAGLAHRPAFFRRAADAKTAVGQREHGLGLPSEFLDQPWVEAHGRNSPRLGGKDPERRYLAFTQHRRSFVRVRAVSPDRNCRPSGGSRGSTMSVADRCAASKASPGGSRTAQTCIIPCA